MLSPRQLLQRSSASVSSNARRKLPRTKLASGEESRFVYSGFMNLLIFQDVIKYVKKGEKGFAVLAGDTFPIDVYW